LNEIGDKGFEALVHESLINFGEINSEFAPIFLERGGLFIFFDGLNAIGDSTGRARLNTFIEKYGKRNYICISSEHIYPEIKNMVQLDFNLP